MFTVIYSLGLQWSRDVLGLAGYWCSLNGNLQIFSCAQKICQKNPLPIPSQITKAISRWSGAPDEEISELIDKLVADTKQHLGPENYVVFDGVKWDENGGTNEESLKGYLEQLGAAFEEKIRMLLDRVRLLRRFSAAIIYHLYVSNLSNCLCPCPKSSWRILKSSSRIL